MSDVKRVKPTVKFVDDTHNAQEIFVRAREGHRCKIQRDTLSMCLSQATCRCHLRCMSES